MTFLIIIVPQVMADISIEDAAKEEFDCIVLPGGMPGTYLFRFFGSPLLCQQSVPILFTSSLILTIILFFL